MSPRTRYRTVAAVCDTAWVSIPTYDQIIEPLLRYLAQHQEPVPTRDAYTALADRLGLSESERQELLPSRQQAVYQNRIGWAHDRLKRAGLSASPSRSMWQLTEQGRKFVAEHPRPLTPEHVEQLAHVDRDTRLRPIEITTQPRPTTDKAATHQSPDERIDAALAELREQTASELLDRLLEQTPAFFEQVVLDLLHALGYGTSRADLARVGKTGDGGIDGIISLDRLGLEKVYVQAKRWQNTVGRPDVQSFFGALAGRRATKGVVITTSTFSREAREFAESVSDKIVLVDGARLTELMMDHGVGVQHKSIQIPRVDSDYFEET
jgi:restriction system protein